MQASNVYAPITGHSATIFVAIFVASDVSLKIWLLTMHSPAKQENAWRISRERDRLIKEQTVEQNKYNLRHW